MTEAHWAGNRNSKVMFVNRAQVCPSSLQPSFSDQYVDGQVKNKPVGFVNQFMRAIKASTKMYAAPKMNINHVCVKRP